MSITIKRSLWIALSGILFIAGCTLPPIPKPSDTSSIILIHYPPGSLLMSEKTNRIPVNDGRFFNVSTGIQTLEVRFKFPRPYRYPWSNDEQTCLIAFRAHFEPNHTYILNGLPSITGGTLHLSLNGQKVPLTNIHRRCGPY